MVMVTRQDYLVKREYYKDQAREIQRDRFARQVLVRRQRSNRFYSGALIWLGRRLVAWGRSLQERYSTAASASMSQPANQAVS